MQAVAAVLLVLCLAAFAIAALVRSGRVVPGTGGGLRFSQVLRGPVAGTELELKILSRRQVAPGSWMVLAETGNRRVLVVVGAQATAVDAWTEAAP